VELEQLTQLPAVGPIGATIGQFASEARHLLGHTKLTDVTEVEFIPERTLESFRRFRHAEPLVTFVRSVREAIDLFDTTRLRATINSQVLAPLTDDRLFELMVGFDLVEAFVEQGFRQDVDLVEPGVPFARFRWPYPVEIYWQRSPWRIFPSERAHSRYRQTLRSARMPVAALRPDFFLVVGTERRPMIVEVKQTTREGSRPERRGILDAMAYLHDAQDVVARVDKPHALVVAWNARATPALDEIVVASQDTLKNAVELLLAAWSPNS
jgi:hypothetical protein